jgi:hypothetical protein
LLGLDAAKLASSALRSLDLIEVSASEYRRLRLMTPPEQAAALLEHFRHGDTCFVARRDELNKDVGFSFVSWAPAGDIPRGYAYVHYMRAIEAGDLSKTHFDVLEALSREAVGRGKRGIVYGFDSSDLALLNLAEAFGFQQLA